jgi:hypothetical protein
MKFDVIPNSGTMGDAATMTSIIKTCGKCAAEMFEDAPPGFCPACLLETSLNSLDEEVDGSAATPASPGSIAVPCARMLTDFGRKIASPFNKTPLAVRTSSQIAVRSYQLFHVTSDWICSSTLRGRKNFMNLLIQLNTTTPPFLMSKSGRQVAENKV